LQNKTGMFALKSTICLPGLLLLVAVALCLPAQAQDNLYLTNGTVVLTKGIHVKGDSLYYMFANDTS